MTAALPAAPDGAVTVVNYLTLTLNAGELETGGGFWSSFWALLIAGLILANVNSRFMHEVRRQNEAFSKEERFHKIADSFCISIEQSVVEFFESSHGDKQHKRQLNKKILAHVETLVSFIRNNASLPWHIRQVVIDKCGELNEWNEDEQAQDGGKLTAMLTLPADIRYSLTQ